MSQDQEPTVLLPIREVLRRLGVSRSTLRHMTLRGEFPAPCRVGPRRVAWPEREVDAWIAQRLAERDHGAAA